uniref:Uncharacterized protein n=1 Tax=Tetradesmus obliquus TaxID=3088 RepID=A0A383W5F7_TETOB
MPVPTPAELSGHTAAVRNSSIRRSAYVRNELLLRQIVEECVRRQNTVLQLRPHQPQLQVLPSLPDDAPCPPLDIALRGSERGVGSCTDVALYASSTPARA